MALYNESRAGRLPGQADSPPISYQGGMPTAASCPFGKPWAYFVLGDFGNGNRSREPSEAIRSA